MCMKLVKDMDAMIRRMQIIPIASVTAAIAKQKPAPHAAVIVIFVSMPKLAAFAITRLSLSMARAYHAVPKELMTPFPSISVTAVTTTSMSIAIDLSAL